MSAHDEARRAYDTKTKPRGSLGRLEDLGCRLAEIRGFVPARLDAAIVVAAGDHGVAAEGVSAYPQEVTAQMVANFAAGGAAINVLARHAGARLIVVDAGIVAPFEHELVRSIRIGPGTANIAVGPAMTEEQEARALAAGEALAGDLDVDVIGLGEMGIANTTSASALTAALLEVDAALVCGRGTGLDDDGVARKTETVRRALEINAGRDPLAELGGFEIAFLAGVVLGCERRRIAVLLDGFITCAAARGGARSRGGSRAHRCPAPGRARRHRRRPRCADARARSRDHARPCRRRVRRRRARARPRAEGGCARRARRQSRCAARGRLR